MTLMNASSMAQDPGAQEKQSKIHHKFDSDTCLSKLTERTSYLLKMSTSFVSTCKTQCKKHANKGSTASCERSCETLYPGKAVPGLPEVGKHCDSYFIESIKQ